MSDLISAAINLGIAEHGVLALSFRRDEINVVYSEKVRQRVANFTHQQLLDALLDSSVWTTTFRERPHP